MSSKSLLLAVFFLGALALRAPAYPSTPNSVTAALWNFNSGDGSFAVANSAGVEGPWTYDPTVGIGGTGGWFANGSGAVGVPTSSVLTSPTLTITARGPVTLSFDHRYSFEYDGVRWDGGNVRVSVNGGPFVVVGNSQFTINGYTGVITGHGILTDQEGFNSDSPGYATPAFIRSIAELGDFQAGETIAIQFAAGWDELALGSRPSWVIDNVCVVEIPADTPPTITQQPQSQTAAIGRDVTFSVMGAGTAPLTYRWIFCPKPYWDQPTNILAATGATLTLSKVQPIDAGDYLAVVSNGFGSVTSRVATLTVCLPMINPSFEADRFSITPGYVLNNGPITGWSGSDANGINPGGGVSPFADNGTIPRGNQVAFLQGGDPISQSSTLSQRVSGFTVGAEYYVQYYENARNCCSGTVPFLEVKIGGATIVAAHPVPPVGGTNPYARV